eukprot:1778-Heterococcus_DN1.PRE.3
MAMVGTGQITLLRLPGQQRCCSTDTSAHAVLPRFKRGSCTFAPFSDLALLQLVLCCPRCFVPEDAL